MPPKGNKDAKANAKAKVEKAKKAAEDKTFGLKNKNKSKTVQQYVTQVSKGASDAAKARGLEVNSAAAKRKKKEADEAAAREVASLFAPTIKQPKPPPGVDPKSIVCEHYRAGLCTKGHKCKYSHDLNVERKGGKADIYADDDKQEGMEDWDQETLEKVVNDKHGKEVQTNTTDIICKFFLDAVEKRLYGWFWQCPNGKDCKYKHKLPPGFKLKSEIKEMLEAEAANKPSLEEEVEAERRQVDAKTPITETTFAQWHARKAAAKKKAEDEALRERKRKGLLTGREIFQQDGFLAEDDAGAHEEYVRENDDEEAFRKAREDAEAANARALAAAGGAPAAAASSSGGGGGPASSPAGPSASSNGGAGPSAAAASSSAGPAAAAAQLSKEDEDLFDEDDDDDDLDDDELEEIERGIGATSLS